MYKFILASKSPRRKELLHNIGYEFEVMESDFDESAVSKELEPQLYVQELAMFKAMSLVKKVPADTLIIGADTVVVHNGSILGKPADRDEAIQMLSSLSNDVHRVYTGVCVVRSNDAKCVAAFEKTSVYLRMCRKVKLSIMLTNIRPTTKPVHTAYRSMQGCLYHALTGIISI